jgi:hypothetical protein
MDAKNLTLAEKQHLRSWVTKMETEEMSQVQDLIDNCNITFQFAKTHSVYVKDWEKTRNQMEERLRQGVLPPGMSANLFQAIINASNEVMQRKLERAQDAFQQKFGESIFNYLGPDGKTKKLFGIFG